jgi:hypothetical protein
MRDVRISIFSTNALNISSSNSSSSESLLFIVSRISSNLCLTHPLIQLPYHAPTFSFVLPQAPAFAKVQLRKNYQS